MIKINLSVDSLYYQFPVKVDIAMPYPVLAGRRVKNVWALHCAMKDGSYFFDNLSIGQYVDLQKVNIIAPSLNYFSAKDPDIVYDFLENELWPFITSLFGLSLSREDNCLLGISMGAFESLKWCDRQPEKFSEAALISGVYDFSLCDHKKIKSNRSLNILYKLILPNARHIGLLDGDKSIMESLSSDIKTRFSVYCGDTDYLCLDNNLSIMDRFNELGISSQFEQIPGYHDQAVWSVAISRFLTGI